MLILAEDVVFSVELLELLEPPRTPRLVDVAGEPKEARFGGGGGRDEDEDEDNDEDDDEGEGETERQVVEWSSSSYSSAFSVMQWMGSKQMQHSSTAMGVSGALEVGTGWTAVRRRRAGESFER